MQRARTMEGAGREDGLRHGLPTRPTHRDALHAAGGAHSDLQQHQLSVRHPTGAAAAAAERTGAPAPAPDAATTPARARQPPTQTPTGATRAAGQTETRQEQAAGPRPVRPRATTTTTTATAAAAAATTAARAEPEQRQRRGGSRPRPAAGAGVSGVLPVHAVAAAEVGGDAAAARVLLRGVPVQLPDAGARGDLQHRHRRQPAHHHLQRGEPQRLRDRVSGRARNTIHGAVPFVLG